MNGRLTSHTLLLIALISALIVNNWAAVLPTRGEQQQQQQHQWINQLQSAELDGQQQQFTHQHQIPHQSYDTNDDVVVVVGGGGGTDDMAEVNRLGDNNDDYNDENDHESNDEASVTLHERRRRRRELSDWLIAPNTRWCGRGNSANNTYNHLGGASSADKCCRKHDHCQLFINSMSNRYELFNYRPYTLSHCNCDRRFRTCLKMANDEDAKTIGKVFFNMVQTQCFVLKTERVCRKRSADGGVCEREEVKQRAYLRNNKRF